MELQGLSLQLGGAIEYVPTEDMDLHCGMQCLCPASFGMPAADLLIWPVTHALTTSRLDYFRVLYVGLPLGTYWKLPLVQNAMLRFLHLDRGWMSRILLSRLKKETCYGCFIHFQAQLWFGTRVTKGLCGPTSLLYNFSLPHRSCSMYLIPLVFSDRQNSQWQV